MGFCLFSKIEKSIRCVTQINKAVNILVHLYSFFTRFYDNKGRIGALYSFPASIGLSVSSGFSQIHLCVPHPRHSDPKSIILLGNSAISEYYQNRNFLTHNMAVIQSSVLHSKLHFWPKNLIEKWNRIFLFMNLNLQDQVKKALCYQKLFWPFTVWIDCSSDINFFANSWPSACNFKSWLNQ